MNKNHKEISQVSGERGWGWVELFGCGNVQVAILCLLSPSSYSNKTTLPHLSCIFLVVTCLHPARQRTSVVY